MAVELPPLPFAHNALEPYISEETLNYHYDKHHRAYVTKLNGLIADTEHSEQTLETMIKTSSGGIFNNAAQVWNHSFYWNCLSAEHDQVPGQALEDAINDSFGSLDQFKEQFTQTALTTFGSGWAWLVKNPDSSLEIVSTSNAQNPLPTGQTPLLTCDVWEHAYYIDTRNDRAKYVENFWHLVNWEFVSSNFLA